MLDELRTFVMVVDAGSFTAAARPAGRSQPALTAAIQRLEQSVGAVLLTRGRSGASPTAAGEALLPHARAALAAVEEGRRAVAELQGLQAGQVRVGAGATFCTYVLPAVLRALREAHPGLRLSLREGHTAELLDELSAGRLDLVAVPATPDPPPGLTVEPWLEDELVLVARPGLPATGQPFLTFARPSPTRALLDQHFPDVEVALELNSVIAVKGSAREGLGVALLSRVAVAGDLADGRLSLVDDPRAPLTRRIVIAHRGLERLSPGAADLRERLLGMRFGKGAGLSPA